jgi:hypothetical protein
MPWVSQTQFKEYTRWVSLDKNNNKKKVSQIFPLLYKRINENNEFFKLPLISYPICKRT